MKKILLALFAAALLFTSCQHDYEDELKRIREENAKNTELIQDLKDDLDATKEDLGTTQEQLKSEKLRLAKAYAELFSRRTGFVLDTQYNGEYDFFKIASDGKVSYWGMSGTEVTETDTVGYIVDLIVPTGYEGLIAVVETLSHTNFGQYCYPDYNQTATGEAWGSPCYTHAGCYVGFYCKPIGQGLYMAQSVWNVPGHTYTACAETLTDFYKLYELYGYDMTCDNLSSQYSR